MPTYTDFGSGASSLGGLAVLYEDNHVIVVFKPAGVLTQGDASGEPCLMDAVRDYLKVKYQKPGNVFLGLVHRLDRPVCGVVMFARTSKGASRLSEQVRTRAVEKIYHALVEGCAPKQAQLVHYLGVDGSQRVEVSDLPVGGLKRSALSYRRLSESSGRSLLEVSLETGRKHQIRAQLSASGLPIVGDTKYGARTKLADSKAIALMAKRLTFRHPVREEQITVEAPDSLAPWEAR